MNDIAVDDALVREAAALTAQHPLQGYEAVHCAAALRLADDDVVAVTGDRSLLTARMAEGLAVIDTQA